LTLTANFFLCQSRLSKSRFNGTKRSLVRFAQRRIFAKQETTLERISVEDSYEDIGARNVPVGGPDHPLAQFEFGAEDRHNWQGRSDERIKLAVMTALHWDLAVPRDRVQVSVARGWVTLTGRVVRAYEKSRAEAVARTTRGIGGLTNKITCLPED
jgi:BON domain